MADGQAVSMGAAAPEAGFRSRYFTSRDGLRLHIRTYGQGTPGRRPVVCLPGLSRNAADFDALAQAMIGPGGLRRRVYAIDYRGRGRSAWDPDWTRYTPLVEAHDVLDFMTLAGLTDAAIIGTSRGGIIAMLMAVLRPRAVGAVVLNDIGPEIDPIGLMRIAGVVGRLPLPATWTEAAALMQQLFSASFPAIAEQQWPQIARALFDDLAGVPGPAYDPALAHTLAGLSRGTAPPPLWPQFTALLAKPVLVLRGEHSDILSETTVMRMREKHPDLTAVTVQGEGHAPFLLDKATHTHIERFFDRAELSGRAASMIQSDA